MEHSIDLYTTITARIMFDYAVANNLTFDELIADKILYTNAINTALIKLNKLTNLALEDNNEVFNRTSLQYKIKEQIINTLYKIYC